MTSFSVLEKLTTRNVPGPDVPAIIDTNGNTISHGEMLRRIRAIARGFSAAGLRPGDKVLFAVRSDADATLLKIAICEAGGVLVPLDPTMGPALFRSRMQMLSPRWVVAESVLYLLSANRWIARLLAWRGMKLPPIEEVKAANFVHVGPAWPGIPVGLSLSALEQLGEESGNPKRSSLHDEAPTIIVFTSGTTGTPKAVVHSRRSMQGVFHSIGSLLDAGSGDVIYARELHLILPALFAGSAVVVPYRSGFPVKRFIRELKRRRVTHFFGVAAELQEIVDYLCPRKQTLPQSLREIWIGAAPVHAAFLQEVQTILARDTQVWCVYGMTEILPVARVSLAEKLRYEGDGDLVGECVPGVSARVSMDGELIVRGPNLFSGYFGEPSCAEHATGDLARLDMGRIVLLGRRKDMIVRGRFNIYPELYEPTIDRIEGVRRCAMIGFYDDAVSDERVVLAVEPDAGVDAGAIEKRLWRELRNGPFSIDSAALPDDILLMALPLAGRSGKVDKLRLREYARQRTLCASR